MTLFCWGSALIAAAAALVLASYTSRDPDSTVYSEISARLSVLPFRAWIAPEWGGSWGFTGPFREHPVGIFVLPALLARAGYPAKQAAFALGALFSVLSLYLVKRIAAPLVREHEATAVQWAALILPIAFVYRVRANQEYPVLVLTLLALVATERARRSAVWIAGVVCAACALALVKGVFVVFLPALCGLWLLLVRTHRESRADTRAAKDDRAAWLGVALAIVAVAALAWMYEWTYHRATGDSFLQFYLENRIAENAGLAAERSFSVEAKLYNLVWYIARLAWFAVPGSLVLIASVGCLRRAAPDDVRRIWFPVLASALYVGAMSLGANKADRFIFPAYFFVGVAGAVVAVRRWDRIDRLARGLASLPVYALPLAWFLLFLLALASEHRLPHVKLWRS